MTLNFILIFQIFIFASMIKILLELFEIKDKVQIKQSWDRLNESTERLHKILDEEKNEEIRNAKKEN